MSRDEIVVVNVCIFVSTIEEKLRFIYAKRYSLFVEEVRIRGFYSYSRSEIHVMTIIPVVLLPYSSYFCISIRAHVNNHVN